MKLNKFGKVLILAPHTDDGELGLGGSINHLIEKGNDIYCHTFSNASKSLPKNLPKNILEVEFNNAMKMLGIPKENLTINPYELRTFTYHRQEILDRLIKIRDELKPDLIFLPSLTDIHQDHQVIAQEGLRAFKKSCILGYELPWNNITFPTDCFIVLKEEHVEKKIEALACYNTQKYRTYLNPEFIRSLAITRGTQIQVNFAEAFEMIRWVWD